MNIGKLETNKLLPHDKDSNRKPWKNINTLFERFILNIFHWIKFFEKDNREEEIDNFLENEEPK